MFQRTLRAALLVTLFAACGPPDERWFEQAGLIVEELGEDDQHVPTALVTEITGAMEDAPVLLGNVQAWQWDGSSWRLIESQPTMCCSGEYPGTELLETARRFTRRPAEIDR